MIPVDFEPEPDRETVDVDGRRLGVWRTGMIWWAIDEQTGVVGLAYDQDAAVQQAVMEARANEAG